MNKPEGFIPHISEIAQTDEQKKALTGDNEAFSSAETLNAFFAKMEEIRLQKQQKKTEKVI